MTDEFGGYTQAGKQFAAHETVKHSKREYARGVVHTNTVEGFFGQLKTSLDGTYHHVSRKHLDRYLAEFDYRYSTRNHQRRAAHGQDDQAERGQASSLQRSCDLDASTTLRAIENADRARSCVLP